MGEPFLLEHQTLGGFVEHSGVVGLQGGRLQAKVGRGAHVGGVGGHLGGERNIYSASHKKYTYNLQT